MLGKIDEFKPQPLSGPFYVASVGRVFDLAGLPDSERSKGFEHIQNLIEQDLESQADLCGLTGGEYIRLVRSRFPSGSTVNPGQIRDSRDSLALIEGFFPITCREFRDQEMPADLEKALYRLAARGRVEECLFWDRLAADFRVLVGDPSRGLGMVLGNMKVHQDKKKNAPEVRFTGKLVPCRPWNK
jgi:hypothetical protein